MDELELLKKDWNKQTEQKNLSAKDIYPMLHKKSSSIAKTLFYISIAELVFWTLINLLPFFTSTEYRARLNAIYSNDLLFGTLTVFSYGVILLFIYLLFKSYKSISVTDNAKKLMESILNTRKIIKYYVVYNLVIAFVSVVVGLVYAINYNPDLNEQLSHFSTKQLIIFDLVMIAFVGGFLILLWLFYKLIYGLLLKRLNNNYNELKKLEV